MKKIYKFALALSFLFGVTLKAQLTTTLNPVQDAYFISFGGGQGCNPMLKFNISSLPPGSTISKATLKVYVYALTPASSGGAVFGNMTFKNLNNKQNWTEADSAFKYALNNNLYSDTVIQLSGFGNAIGWATSSDLKSIIKKDYLLYNTYCTISMKDPDDMTCCSAFGPNFSPFLGDQTDSIIAGNKVIGADEMIFYPREYFNVNLIPQLIIEYTCTKSTNQNISLCAGDSIKVGVNVHKNTGIYNDTLTGMFGCDSVVTTNLIVKAPLNISVSSSGNTLTSNEVGATYQWIDCGNGNVAIGGQTSQTYTYFVSGSYAVIVTKNACSDTSACNNVVFSNITHTNQTGILIYPNPTNNLLHIDIGNNAAQLIFTDVLGRTIYQANNSTGKTQINLSDENKGLYFLKVSAGGKTEVYKIIKD